MVIAPRTQKALAAAAVALLGLLAWQPWSGSPAATGVSRPTERVAGPAGQIPVIGLQRLAGRQAGEPGEGRNPLEFQPDPTPPPEPTPPPTPPPVTQAPPPTQPPVPVAPTPTPLPPLNVRFVGAIAQEGAPKLAVFVMGGDLVTGRPGDLVANRFRVVKIGLESVDIQELGSEQPRRIPLKGN